MKFKTKNDLGYIVLLLLVCLWAFLFYKTSFYSSSIISSTIIIGAVVALILFTILHSYILLKPECLIIILGFMKQEIPCFSITQIRETNNPLSSMAMSLDRLSISYNQYESVMISVRNKEGFLLEMVRINPNIEIIRKYK